MSFVLPLSHAEANLMLCSHRYVINKSTEIHLPDTQENTVLSEEEVEENLALILNFHLLEFGGYSGKQEITFYPWEHCYKELYSVLFQ